MAAKTSFITGEVRVSRVGVGQGIAPPDRQGVDFDPKRFEELIRKKGVPVTWEKAMLCPNRINASTPGDHDPNCTICQNGYLYIEPIETVMVVQGASLQQNFYIQGRFDSGTATVTSPPEHPISYWDRLMLHANTIRHTELVRRRMNTIEDLLRYRTLSVQHVQAGLRVFKQGTDYRVDGDKLIWTDNVAARPVDGEFYSIMYTRRPIYIVLDMVKHHRDVHDTVEDTYRAMPVQALAKLDFLVRDEARDAPAVPDPPDPFATQKP